MTMRNASCLWVAAIVTLAGASASATVQVPADLPALVQAASAIVHGRIVSVEPRMAGGRRSIEREVTLVVAESYKGALGPEVSLRVPGGELGHYRTVMVGAPRFTPGEEVVLFLGTRGEAPYVIGLTQGVFRVRVDAESGARVVTPPPGRSGEGSRVVRGDASRRPLPLAQFAQEIRQLESRVAWMQRRGHP